MDITYCLNCHNRLWQLQQTIEHNLQFTKANEVEICILAYNDETVEPYLVENFSEYINDGRLVVKSQTDDKPYTFGYVKNLSHSIGSGRVLFNLDADNYIDGVEQSLYNLKDDEILVTELSYLKDGRGGRIGISRNTFNRLGGYQDNQERPDDDDFVYRAMRAGIRLKRASCKVPPIPNNFK